MTTPAPESRKKTTPPSIAAGLVFELEKTALPGQRILFEACQKVLKDKQVVLTPVLWARFGLASPLAQGLERLLAALDRKSVAVEKLAREIRDIYVREIARPAVKVNPALQTLLTETLKLGIKAGGLSFLADEQAKSLLAHLGLQESVRLCVMRKAAVNAPTPDCWLITCKDIGVPARRCVAVVQSAAACNAALEAGLRCVVVPDEFTAYQDFGGADLVVEDLKDVHAADLQALLHSCAFR